MAKRDVAVHAMKPATSMNTEKAMKTMGTSGYSGTLNGRGISGCARRMWMRPTTVSTGKRLSANPMYSMSIVELPMKT